MKLVFNLKKRPPFRKLAQESMNKVLSLYKAILEFNLCYFKKKMQGLFKKDLVLSRSQLISLLSQAIKTTILVFRKILLLKMKEMGIGKHYKLGEHLRNKTPIRLRVLLQRNSQG
jgi:hypothetical protein